VVRLDAEFKASILPGGDGFETGRQLIRAGIVTDGPYVEAKEWSPASA